MKQLSFRLLCRFLSQPVYYHCTGTLLIPECWLCSYLLLWKRVYHLCRLFRASACKIILSADRHNFKFSLSYIYPFQFFIHFICYCSTFTLSFVLSYSGKFVLFFHFLDFNGNALDFHQYTVLTIHLMHIVFIVLKYFSFNSLLLQNFYCKGILDFFISFFNC